jgi:peptidoglycan/LPS O-acetylase OafA/YrhL
MRNRTLDVLRALAALDVLLAHADQEKINVLPWEKSFLAANQFDGFFLETNPQIRGFRKHCS